MATATMPDWAELWDREAGLRPDVRTRWEEPATLAILCRDRARAFLQSQPSHIRWNDPICRHLVEGCDDAELFADCKSVLDERDAGH